MKNWRRFGREEDGSQRAITSAASMEEKFSIEARSTRKGHGLRAEMAEVQRQALWRLIEFFKTDAVTAGLIGRAAPPFLLLAALTCTYLQLRCPLSIYLYFSISSPVSFARSSSFSINHLPSALRSPFNWITAERTNRKIRSRRDENRSRVCKRRI